ncbi:hypothetical protein D9758_007508 [Tetrapyrgos nigripes]|uniref:Uncharacterized protein n=1 Tax=Tetrapyrgos nigripes TaxID=182062 RepID=A0A8H5LHI4_9AGAR|nr:hypothetical protein D9758_007508 [Tetrapyrgos nigripes]
MPSSKSAVPNKKPALGSASSSKPIAIKKESGTTTTSSTTGTGAGAGATTKAPPAAKSDSSFFSAPKTQAQVTQLQKSTCTGEEGARCQCRPTVVHRSVPGGTEKYGQIETGFAVVFCCWSWRRCGRSFDASEYDYEREYGHSTSTRWNTREIGKEEEVGHLGSRWQPRVDKDD